jgi:hypothetical protein
LTTTSITAISQGSDCRDAFRAAYQNRYTWDPGFSGYSGRCIWLHADRSVEGTFRIGADLKAKVEGVTDSEVQKAFNSQLWEVCIHRVRRTFEQTHSENTFTAGDSTDEGLEVIIGGKGKGDKYRIKNDIVTMVHRHIHGTVVTIHTESTTDTGRGYLSRSYTSQYADPTSGELRGGMSHFLDTFVPVTAGGCWVLSERTIRTDAFSDTPENEQTFRFTDLTAA